MDNDITRAIDELEQAVPATAGRPVVVRHILENLAHRSYENGRSQALLDLRSTADVAAELGMTPGGFRNAFTRLRKTNGMYADMGWHTGRDWVFTAGDIEALRQVLPGKPGRRAAG